MEDDHGPKPDKGKQKKGAAASSSSRSGAGTQGKTSPKNQGRKNTSRHKDKTVRDHIRKSDERDQLKIRTLYLDKDGRTKLDSPCEFALAGKHCKHSGFRGRWCERHRSQDGYGEVDPPERLPDDGPVKPDKPDKRPKLNDTFEQFCQCCLFGDTEGVIELFKNRYVVRLMSGLQQPGPGLDSTTKDSLEFLAEKMTLLNVRAALMRFNLIPTCACKSEVCNFTCLPYLSLTVPDEQTFQNLFAYTSRGNYRALTSFNTIWTKNVYDNMNIEIHDFVTHWLPNASLQDLEGPRALAFLNLCDRRSWLAKEVASGCCVLACQTADCSYGSRVLSTRRSDIRRTPVLPTVRPSDLPDQELYLDVVTSSTKLGPSVVIALIFSFFALFFEFLPLVHVLAICLTMLLCLNVLDKTWYTARPLSRLTCEQLIEIERLQAPSEVGASNAIGNQQERESFQVPEYRRVLIEDHTFLTQMFERSDGSTTEIPAWLREIEKRSYGFASVFLQFGLGFMFSYQINVMWFIASVIILKFERCLKQEKLICLNLFVSMTSHVAIRHGKTIDDFIICCDTLARTYSKVPLPSVVSFMVPNCDNVPGMTRDVATLVFHHRKNAEAKLPYLKAIAPRINGPFSGLLVMVTGFFLPLWHSLVPLLQWLGVAALPVWNGFCLIQTVFPEAVTVFFLSMGGLFSLAHATHLLMPALLMGCSLERFIVFVDEYPTRILGLCGVSDDSHGGSCGVTLIRLGATSFIFMTGFCLRIIRRLSVLYLCRCLSTSSQDSSGEYSTISAQPYVGAWISRESFDSSADDLSISGSYDDSSALIQYEERNSKSAHLSKSNSILASSYPELSTDELSSAKSFLDP
jgi:hypothetical protein